MVGGYVYRGSAMPNLEGYYIFGDYSASGDGPPDGVLLWAEAPADGGSAWDWGELSVAGMPNDRLGAYVLTLGEDNDGELYVLTSTGGPTAGTGQVWKLVPPEDGAEVTAEATVDAPADTGAESSAPTEAPMTTPESSG